MKTFISLIGFACIIASIIVDSEIDSVKLMITYTMCQIFVLQIDVKEGRK